MNNFRNVTKGIKTFNLADLTEISALVALNNWLFRQSPVKIFLICIYGFYICFGGFFNITSLIILIRRRLWQQHEGYLHLMAIIISNITTITITQFPIWISLFGPNHHVELISDVSCKIWNFFARFQNFTTLFVVALLLDVYLRRHVTSERLCIKKFASKYCTIRGAQVVICLITVLYVALNLWRSMLYKLYERKFVSRVFKFCNTKEAEDLSFGWELAELCLVLYIPLVAILPFLLIMIRCTGDRSYSTQTNTKDFTMTSIYITVSIFVSKFPVAISYLENLLPFVSVNRYLGSFIDYDMFDIMHCLLSLSYLLVIPVACLSNLVRMRNEARVMFRTKCYLRNAYSANVETGSVVSVEATENQSSIVENMGE